MEAWILEVVAGYGYFGIFLLIALENIFPPIPSELILAFGGFMVAVTPMNLFGAVSAATLGSLTGAAVLYGLGRGLGVNRMLVLVDRWGRILRIGRRDIDRAMGWFGRYQGKTVFFCRMVPLVRSLISIPAGLAHMPAGRFLALTALGSAIWNTVLVGAGALLGERWQDILGFFRIYAKASYLILGLLCMGLLLVLVRPGKRR